MTDETLPEPDGTRDAYYARAGSWASDRERSVRLVARTAWIVAAVATVVALFEAYALSALSPLKTVVPYTLLVDRTTGFVQVLKGTETAVVASDEALTQSQLAQYVIAREGYEIAGIQAQYRKVTLWSAERARADYLGLIAPTSANSPIRQLPRTSTIAVHVKSVSFTNKDSAFVRFDTERLDQGQVAGIRSHWIALVRYRYSGAPMAIEDRFINPLGFQVTDYRRDQEALPVAVEQPVPAASDRPVARRTSGTPGAPTNAPVSLRP